MKAEIEATVKLWVDHIVGGTQDMGEGFCNGLATMLKNLQKPLTDEQVALFEQKLTELLTAKCLEYWNEEDPDFGMYGRDLSVDYGMCLELQEATKFAGINEAFVPIKSSTQTCPGYVYYAFGYSAKKQKLLVTNQLMTNG